MKNLKQFIAEGVLVEKAPPGAKAMAFIKGNASTFKKKYGKTWEDVLYAVAWKKFGGGSDTNESADPTLEEGENNFNSASRTKKGSTSLLQKKTELIKVKERHRDEDKRVKTRQKSEKERAELTDFRSKDQERKVRERARVEKIRKGVYESAFIEELYNSIGNDKFEMLLRNGLSKRSDMIRFKLALEKMSNGKTPTLVERDIFFSVFDKIVKFITEDPQLFTRVHQKVVADRA